MFNNQISKLRYLENKINQVQDNIAAPKTVIIYPAIFTKEEIQTFDIDFYKLKVAKMGVLLYKNQSIVIVIKIPSNYIVTDVKLIAPIPNNHNLEMIVTLNNNNYKYIENVMFKDLKISKHCVFTNTCNFKFNNKTNVQELTDDTLLVKNTYLQ